MKLSTKGRYAVMAMADIARYGKGRPIPLSDISMRQEISLSYLEQLFSKLRRGGLVRSVRGPGGGYLLFYSAEDTRILDIILAVDESIRHTRCEPGSSSGCRASSGRCITHELWEELTNRIHDFLASVSLADVVNHRVGGKRSEAGNDSPAIAAR